MPKDKSGSSKGEQGPIISKSRYLAGLQCPRLLWFQFNQPDAFPPADAATQARFDQGAEVGSLAKRLFPKGTEIGEGMIGRAVVDKLSRAALPGRRPLFEAGFISGCAYARADVLVPVGRKQWDIVEVKSTSEAKPVHIEDLALQRHVFEKAGLSIRQCFVMHLNSQYVRRGEIDPHELLTATDVTDDVFKAADKVGGALKKMVTVAGLSKPPAVAIGPQCANPYDCPLKDDCWRSVPQHSVFTLTRLGVKAFDWFHDGITQLRDLPADTSVTPKQAIQIRAVRTKRPHIDRKALRGFLDELEYPLYFLDFETINLAIPPWDQTSPYQQVPFQFSLHTVRQPGGKPEHRAFLADGPADPRREILALLKRFLGQRGSIVAYNASFEKNVLKASSAIYPAFAPWWNQTEARVVDLWRPFRDFHYYHPDQCGSASMKAVLPAMTGKGYGDMEIADGGTASMEFARITFGDVSAAERKKVRADLEAYCALDTQGMVRIVEKLAEFATAKD